MNRSLQVRARGRGVRPCAPVLIHTPSISSPVLADVCRGAFLRVSVGVDASTRQAFCKLGVVVEVTSNKRAYVVDGKTTTSRLRMAYGDPSVADNVKV